MAHLKRIRKVDSKTTLLLAFVEDPLQPPQLPEDVDLPSPYQVLVPQFSALTMTSLKLKSTLWPTLYTPSRKSDLEPLSRGKVRWACEAMKHVVIEAEDAKGIGEVSKDHSIPCQS